MSVTTPTVCHGSCRTSPDTRRPVRVLMLLLLALPVLMPGPAAATTKGLNQIVTPDIQPEGVLSISVQSQSPQIANPLEIQLELGLTRRLEAAVFRGFDPGETIGAVEYALVQQRYLLVSTGFANWSSRGQDPQPFLEAGYYTDKNHWIAGVAQSEGRTEVILGWQYSATASLLPQVDYQSGSENFATVGFTYILSPALSFNPALYISNDSPHKVYGYAVLSWNVALWK